ncbi:MAG: MBL fold metallo-hydrolase [Deltaproteobacteria bacterium]|nr:MBL fold metallo-hydrolase [Deltaproteobacteria bacterium]
MIYASSLCGRPRVFGDAVAQLLAPCPGYDSGLGLNDNSLVLRLDYGRRRLLFTGDVEALAEHGLLRLGRALYADVLKVAHHGSHTSSTSRFLELVEPRWSVISCGRQNRFGHPHPDALARLRQAATYALRTDRLGGISVETDGRWLDVTPTLPWPSLPAAGGVLEVGDELRSTGRPLERAASVERRDPVAPIRVVEAGVTGGAR